MLNAQRALCNAGPTRHPSTRAGRFSHRGAPSPGAAPTAHQAGARPSLAAGGTPGRAQQEATAAARSTMHNAQCSMDSG
eukprot:11155382-Lingulodinium_polyedra.AAC.1